MNRSLDTLSEPATDADLLYFTRAIESSHKKWNLPTTGILGQSLYRSADDDGDIHWGRIVTDYKSGVENDTRHAISYGHSVALTPSETDGAIGVDRDREIQYFRNSETNLIIVIEARKRGIRFASLRTVEEIADEWLEPMANFQGRNTRKSRKSITDPFTENIVPVGRDRLDRLDLLTALCVLQTLGITPEEHAAYPDAPKETKLWTPPKNLELDPIDISYTVASY